MAKNAEDGILKDLLDHAKALHKVGAINDADLTKMKKVTARNEATIFKGQIIKGTIVATTYTPERIKNLREANSVSQAVFATLINAKKSTVQKWESGKNLPKGPTIKLLDLIDKKGIEVLQN